MRKPHSKSGIIFTILFTLAYLTGCATGVKVDKPETNNKGSYNSLDLDTVKAGKFDTGKMWTFDFPPVKYFEKEYKFKPTEKWLSNVRMSALKFANYCSASFVSEDGLVMTNHHCGRRSVAEVSRPGEDLYDNGFYAKTMADERPVPGLYVDQLVLIKDVTKDIQSAIDKGTTPEEKLANRQKALDEIEKKESEKTGLRIKVVTFYNGGRYSEYGYKRYNDVRLVFSPEAALGYFGGDYDNFTYPRYDLDCNFFRVYENGKPLKTDHYFKWSPDGAEPGEPVFVVGNPGHTDRLKTVSQLEFLRDIQYPRTVSLYRELVNIYSKIIKEHPERKTELRNRVFRYANSLKAYTGMLKGLRNPVLMRKKIDFENKFKEAVNSNSELKAEYGGLWSKIAETQKRLRKISNKDYVLNISPYHNSEYFFLAQDVIDLAYQLKIPVDERADVFKGAELDSTVNDLIPSDINNEMNRDLLKAQVDRMYMYLGADNPVLQKITGGNTGFAAVDYMLRNSYLTGPDKLNSLVKKGPDAILNSDDPFIYFLIKTEPEKEKLRNEISEITSEEDNYSRELGKALFDVYGTSIPPDATFTLRISDGVVKGFPYNGTVAPPFTTFYGLYNRYYSFGRKYPWNLPKRWLNPPDDFKLETPMDFVSTNDIIGGNSGSPVINEKAQIVGLAFDGNIQSLPGNFIFTSGQNRTVSVHSEGMLEAIKDIYKAKRLSDELKYGRIIAEDSVSAVK